MRSLSSFVAAAGLALLASTITLEITQAPLGSPLFFTIAAVMTAAYAATLWRIWRAPSPRGRQLAWLFVLCVAIRAPLLIIAPDAMSDMVRYLWDGRVQRFGLNPYRVVPADPAVAHLHTDETRQMPSRRVRTPYPPGAQLFFRAVTTIHESTIAIRLALVAADLITIVMVWRLLLIGGRNTWLALAYAWNPLVILEVAHSGHIDALGAMWIAAAAYWLAARRTTLASVAFVAAVATKLLPIVLAPLFWRRVRVRDAAAGAAVAAAMLLPFMADATVPVGTVPNVIAGIRFNGPVFQAAAALLSAPAAAGLAVLLGLAAALWARWRLDVADPVAWGWPMGIALVCAPVVYPWYLVYFTPFVTSLATLPLAVWTVSVIPVYIVWHLARVGGRWLVPAGVMWVEYAALAMAAGVVFLVHRRRNR